MDYRIPADRPARAPIRTAIQPILAAFTLSLLLVGAGCVQRATDTAIESQINDRLGGKGKVALGDGTVRYQADNGDTVQYGAGARIPAGFPTDVPVYPSAKVTSAADVASSGSASLSLTTSDAADKALAWYDGQLKDWKKTATGTYAGQTTRVYSKDGVTIGLVVGAQAGTTSIIVTRTAQ